MRFRNFFESSLKCSPIAIINGGKGLISTPVTKGKNSGFNKQKLLTYKPQLAVRIYLQDFGWGFGSFIIKSNLIVSSIDGLATIGKYMVTGSVIIICLISVSFKHSLMPVDSVIISFFFLTLLMLTNDLSERLL